MLRVVAGSIGGLGLAFSATLLFSSLGRGPDIPRMALALVPALLAALAVTVLMRQMERIRLVLSEEGVEYHAFVASVRAAWDAVESLGPVTHGLLTGEGLHLRVADARSALLLRLGGFGGPRHGIPLAPFVLPLRGSWLEVELVRRAPRLVLSR